MGCLSSVLPVAGAAIGSVIAPGFGTAIGAGLGSLAAGSGSSNSGGGPSSAVQNAFGSSSNTYSKNPDWINSASQDVYNKAAAAAASPYQQYTGQQVAPLSSNQQLAINNAASQVGQYQPTYGTITNYLNQSASPYTQSYNPGSVGYNSVNSTNNQQSISAPQSWDANAAKQYMSPYLQASLQPQINNINQDYALRQNANNAAAAGAGSFGGDRAGVNSALITKQQQDEINGVTAQGYNTAYNTGLGAFQTANNQNLAAQQAQANIYAQNNASNLQSQIANQQAGINTGEFNQNNNLAGFNANYNVAQGNRAALQNAASGLGNLVNTQSNVNNTLNNQLMSTGNAAQQTQQNLDTTGYQNFLNQFYYPEQQASYLSGILGGSAAKDSISNEYNAGNNGIQNAINQGSGLLGSLGIGNLNGGSTGIGSTTAGDGLGSSVMDELSLAGF